MIDPQILAMIANPTSGKMGEMGKNYVNARNAALENKRNDELLKIKQDEELRAKADIGSKAMGAYSKSVLDEYKRSNIDPTSAEAAVVQKQIYDSFPDAYKPFIPETTQPLDELNRGYNNAINIQNMLNPKEPKTTFEMDTVQNVKTGKLLSRNKADPYLEELVKTGDWIKYYPSQQGTKGDIPATTKQKGESQSAIVDLMTMENDLITLKDRVKGNEDQLTYWGALGGSILTIGEKLGVKLPEGGKEALQTRQGIIDYSNNIRNSYRRLITGSQASEYELENIYQQAPTIDDSETTFNQKINDWLDDTERLRIRHERILKQGYSYVKNEEGNAIYEDKNGVKKELGEIMSINDIPRSSERITQLLELYSGGKPPSSFTAEQIEEMRNRVKRQMASEGYNIKRYE